VNPARALQRIRKRVHPDGLDQLCRGCGGLPPGPCKAAVRALGHGAGD
jgi:hypothetical protein